MPVEEPAVADAAVPSAPRSPDKTAAAADPASQAAAKALLLELTKPLQDAIRAVCDGDAPDARLVRAALCGLGLPPQLLPPVAQQLCVAMVGGRSIGEELLALAAGCGSGGGASTRTFSDPRVEMAGASAGYSDASSDESEDDEEDIDPAVMRSRALAYAAMAIAAAKAEIARRDAADIGALGARGGRLAGGRRVPQHTDASTTKPSVPPSAAASLASAPPSTKAPAAHLPPADGENFPPQHARAPGLAKPSPAAKDTPDGVMMEGHAGAREKKKASMVWVCDGSAAVDEEEGSPPPAGMKRGLAAAAGPAAAMKASKAKAMAWIV